MWSLKVFSNSFCIIQAVFRSAPLEVSIYINTHKWSAYPRLRWSFNLNDQTEKLVKDGDIHVLPHGLPGFAYTRTQRWGLATGHV